MLAVVLGGACNQVYGLDGTTIRDAPPPFELPDGAVLVMPPPGPTTCGSMPDFETWAYQQAVILPSASASDLSPYGATRAIVTAQDRREVWDVDLSTSEATRLTALDPPSGTKVREPSVAPDGSVLWFRQDEGSRGLFVATRASG